MKRFNITVNGKAYDVQVEELGAGAPVAAPTPAAAPAVAAAPAAAPAAPVGEGAIKVESPMPGSIWELKSTVGQVVKAGDVLLILEAMKMENEIVAPQDGTVSAIHVNKSDTVDTGTLLVSMD